MNSIKALRLSVFAAFLAISLIAVPGVGTVYAGSPDGQNLAANPCNPCAANPCNPCAAKNPCNPCNPCAAKLIKANPCNPCAAKNPCAANPCAAKNPCNPCAAKN